MERLLEDTLARDDGGDDGACSGGDEDCGGVGDVKGRSVTGPAPACAGSPAIGGVSGTLFVTVEKLLATALDLVKSPVPVISVTSTL